MAYFSTVKWPWSRFWSTYEELPMKKVWPFPHTTHRKGTHTLMMIFSDWWEYGVLWAWAAAGACVRVSVCVRLHYVHWWPDCDIIWTYLALFRCSSAVFRLSGLLAPGNSLLLSAHYRDLMRRYHHQVHASHTSQLCLAPILYSIFIFQIVTATNCAKMK